MKNDLFQQLRTDFLELKVPASELKTTILNHPEFKAFDSQVKNTFNTWLATQMRQWQSLEQGVQPKQVIDEASQSLLAAFADNALLDTYDIYQHLMSYWSDTMQDDVYSLAIDGWKAGNEYQRLVIKGKKGKDGKSKGDKEITGLAGIEGRMITPNLLISVYFTAMQLAIQEQEAIVETAQARMTEIEEEQSSEEGLFTDLEKVNATEIGKLLKQLKPVKKVKVPVEETYGMVAESAASYGVQNNFEILEEYLLQDITIKGANAKIKKLNADLEKAVLAKYPALSESEIKDLVLVHKWQAHLENALQQEQERISQNLTQRIKELAERYETTLSSLETAANDAASKVKSHLEKMGWTW
ncbi:hypothetical protein [Myroides sp.]|uniref:hypothetical protein n=1 Tax=Myroides sp. TaxID=1874736 RepID=UPI0028AFFE79|nr:hypothetical protein [Myroides sp.]